MINNKNKLKIYSFYRFIRIHNKIKLKNKFQLFLIDKKILGTILLSDEGINGSLSGSKKDLDSMLVFIRKTLGIRKINLKINKVDFFPFNRMKIRIKKEIVSLGNGRVNIEKLSGKLASPGEWDSILKNKETKVIDVRNIYEIEIGSFKGSLNPKTVSFRDFPKSIKKMNIKKNDKIAMYCTGGIRCEKASAYLRMKGFEKVVQLEGGILNYLNYKKKQHNSNSWTGECFVFDQRVSVKSDLLKGRYTQCYGCRHPITKKDQKSKNYKKGVYCPYCVTKRSKKQILSSESRQKQLAILKKNDFKNINYN